MQDNQFAIIDIKALDFALMLYEEFLDKCPDHIWVEKFGGRPVGRQLYHAISASGVYLQSLGNAAQDGSFPGAADPFPAGREQEDCEKPTPSRAEARELLKRVRTMADGFLPDIDDSYLLQQNYPISQFLDGAVSNATVLSIMVGHMLYHLGSCDAALRAGGLPGVFSGLGLVRKVLAQGIPAS